GTDGANTGLAMQIGVLNDLASGTYTAGATYTLITGCPANSGECGEYKVSTVHAGDILNMTMTDNVGSSWGFLGDLICDISNPCINNTQPETPQVIFKDDFLQPAPLPSSSWTIDKWIPIDPQP